LSKNGHHGISLGLRYMVGAAFFFSLMSLFVKLAGRRLPAAEIVFARCVVSLVISYVMVRRAGLSPWGTRKPLLVLRGVAGFSALLCFFYSVTKLPLADVTVLHFTSPAYTALLAWVFLKESMTRPQIAGLMLSLGGVVLVVQPEALFGAGALPVLPVVVALVGSLFTAVAYTTVRKLRESDDALVVIFYFPLIGTPLSIPLMAGNAIWPTPPEWLLLVAVGVVTQVAQIFLTKGLHLESAGRAHSIGYLQIIFAALWGVMFFEDLPNTLGIVGAVLVAGGTLLVARGRGAAAGA
jgi:drug/metabolite transporter (DMT)-like permease